MKKQGEIARKKAAFEKMKRLEREEQKKNAIEEVVLVGMDLSRMSDQQQELYNYWIQELLNRRCQKHQPSQNPF